MVRATRRDTVEYKGHSVEIDQPGLWCTACDEAIFEGDELAVGSRALAAIKAEIENLLPPAEVKRIRTKLGLGVREAGRLLGGGEFAFQKYERGTVVVSEPMANLLRLLDKHPIGLRTLRKAKGVAPSARKRSA
jgi:HTH-type transcriptional regulator/antitoxin MqsA